MLARVLRSESASSARLISTRLFHRPVARRGTFEGEELKLRSGSHYIESLDDAIGLFDEMVRSRPLPSVFEISKLLNVIVRMRHHGVAINLHQEMERRGIPCNNIYTMNTLIYCFCRCREYPYALSTLGKIMKLGFEPGIATFNTLLRGSRIENGSRDSHHRESGYLMDEIRAGNKEDMMFQAALKDLSQPKAEPSAPDGVLTVPLMRHQRIALSWMAEKETNSLSGGFLADDQGLGKTVSTIALILKERSTPSKDCAGTLVVCPTSVMRQWADELQKKVTSEANLSVLVYHGSSRTKDPHELAKYDVVVTTYSIVSMEVPKQPLVEGEDEVKKKKGSEKKKHVDPGPLAKVSWFRVVLDEAHIIKNHKTQFARACWGLRAKRRWCLSGTPIQNSIDDLYSYFRFLRHKPFSSYDSFCDMLKHQVNGYQRVRSALKTVMLRRTKGSLLDGKPIISLPPKSIELRKVDFTEEERDFYSNLESESCDQFQGYDKDGTVKLNYYNILSMLLRLRQACDHPLLVKGEYSTWESSLESAKKQDFSEASLAICGICNDAPEDAVVSVCGHVFCKQCFYECHTGDNKRCPLENCNVRLSAMPSMHDSATSVHVETVDTCSEGLRYESSKIKAALEIIQSLPKTIDGPVKVVGEKAIVFSQWTKMMDLLETSLISSGIQYRRFDGTMSVAARDKAVQEFNTLPEVPVMIMSLKAASLGLNMVAACHVLMLDLWWNPTIEDQAIDRAHRIGQTRPVKVVRLAVKDTVEDRILEIQEEKRRMVASVFGEGAKGRQESRLTAEELRYLFNGGERASEKPFDRLEEDDSRVWMDMVKIEWRRQFLSDRSSWHKRLDEQMAKFKIARIL